MGGSDKPFSGSCGGGRDNPRALCFSGAVQAEPVACDGWVMVPVEPTPEMRSAAIYIYDQWGWNAVPKLWAAMLASSPTQPRPQPLTDEQITRWWSSENGLEDMVMCKLHDFTTMVRAVESRLCITAQEPTE